MNYSWKSLINKFQKCIIFLGFIILFFGYIYNFQFKGFPFSIVKLYFIIVIVYIVINKGNINNIIESKFDFFVCFMATIFPIFFGLLSSCINLETDFSILKDIINIPYYFFAFYILKLYSKKTKQNLSFNYIAKLFVISGFVQCIISFIGFVIPEIGKFLINIQTFNDELERIRAEKFLLKRRLIGLGTRYWSAGIIFSVDLLLISHLLSDKSFIHDKFYKYLSVLYLTIFTIGMMMSRTTIVGFVFSILYVFKNSLKKTISVFKMFLPSVVILSLVAVCFVYSYQERVIKIFSFGFELFINLSSSNGFQSGSTNKMVKMYDFPELDNYKTWLIGDAIFNNPCGNGYYRNTDIGYCRIIFYFGLLGLLSLLITQAGILIVLAKRLDKKYRFFLMIMGLMFLAFNLKGFQLIHFYIIPFFFIDKRNKICNFEKRSFIYA